MADSRNDVPANMVYEARDLRGRKFVEKVAGEYRVREDGVLAEKLQWEEFDYHFSKNKEERFLGHIDIHKAKEIYLKEVQQSGLLTESELRRLCKDDAWLASEVEKRLAEENDMDEQRRTAVEMQDEEFARYLQAKEKEKIEIDRKRRLERRIERDREAALKLQRQFEEEDAAQKVSVDFGRVAIGDAVRDGSDMAVGSQRRAYTKKELQERQDAEIARRIHLKEAEDEHLKLQEEKERKTKVDEENDRRLALKLQKQEADEYKRERAEKELRRAGSLSEEKPMEAEQRYSSDSLALKNRPAPANVALADQRPLVRVPSGERPEQRWESPGRRDGRRGDSQDRLEGASRRTQDARSSNSNSQSPFRDGFGEDVDYRRERMQTKLQSVDATGKPVGSVASGGPSGSQRSNGSLERYRQTDTESSRRTPSKDADPEYRKETPDKRQMKLQSVDATGRPVAVMASGGSSASQRANGSLERERNALAEGESPRRKSSKDPDSPWKPQLQHSSGLESRSPNIMAAIDPTYRGSPVAAEPQRSRMTEVIQPVPVIQNVKRPSSTDDKQKRKDKSK